jgi:hypothetical protein
MSNPFGFIPLPREEEEAADELGELLQVLDARHLSDVLEADERQRASCDVLFAQVEEFADQLQILDPEVHDAAQVVSWVEVALAATKTVHDRLTVLARESARLKAEVVKLKRQKSLRSKLIRALEHAVPFAASLIDALAIPLAGLMIILALMNDGLL